jgi:hypothetical protein
MIVQSFLLVSMCLAPIIKNETGEKFGTPNDMDSYNTATLTCINRYNSCLKYFIKKEPRRFHAICSKTHRGT